MSIVRWNLKEAGGKVPARGTRTASEAGPVGRVCQTKQSPNLSEAGQVHAAGIWDEGVRTYPRRSDRQVAEMNFKAATRAATHD